jgi:hypothetical protein
MRRGEPVGEFTRPGFYRPVVASNVIAIRERGDLSQVSER